MNLQILLPVRRIQKSVVITKLGMKNLVMRFIVTNKQPKHWQVAQQEEYTAVIPVSSPPPRACYELLG